MQTLIQSLHSEFILAHLHRGIDLMDFVLPDEVADCRIRNHNLKCKRSPRAAGLGDKNLRQDTFKDKGKLGPNLGLLVGRKNVNYSVDGLNTRIGMQCSKTKVPRLCKSQGSLNSFKVP